MIAASKGRLSTHASALRCVFVSQDPARQLRELCNNAHMVNSVREFRDAASSEDRQIFDELLMHMAPATQGIVFGMLDDGMFA